jgi:DNA-binding FrmR family transcriptional regulator
MTDTAAPTTLDDAQARADVVARLRRVEGQVAGVVAMIEAGRSCADVVTQLAAASKALDRAGFKIVSSGLQDCLAAEERGEAPALTRSQIEKLFLSLA